MMSSKIVLTLLGILCIAVGLESFQMSPQFVAWKQYYFDRQTKAKNDYTTCENEIYMFQTMVYGSYEERKRHLPINPEALLKSEERRFKRTDGLTMNEYNTLMPYVVETAQMEGKVAQCLTYLAFYTGMFPTERPKLATPARPVTAPTQRVTTQPPSKQPPTIPLPGPALQDMVDNAESVTNSLGQCLQTGGTINETIDYSMTKENKTISTQLEDITSFLNLLLKSCQK